MFDILSVDEAHVKPKLKKIKRVVKDGNLTITTTPRVLRTLLKKPQRLSQTLARYHHIMF